MLSNSLLSSQMPRYADMKQSAAATQPTAGGTAQPTAGQPDRGNAVTNGISHLFRGAGALAKLSLQERGAPFAHISSPGGTHRSLGKASTQCDSMSQVPDAQQSCSRGLQGQAGSAAAGRSSASKSDPARLQENLSERPEDSACSAAQPEGGQQGRKRRRRAAAPFACASAAGAGDDAPPGEWKWPQLPRWKPPR